MVSYGAIYRHPVYSFTSFWKLPRINTHWHIQTLKAEAQNKHAQPHAHTHTLTWKLAHSRARTCQRTHTPTPERKWGSHFIPLRHICWCSGLQIRQSFYFFRCLLSCRMRNSLEETMKLLWQKGEALCRWRWGQGEREIKKCASACLFLSLFYIQYLINGLLCGGCVGASPPLHPITQLFLGMVAVGL